MSVVPDGKRYSPFDPNEVHRDMQVDPDATRRNMIRSPAVLEKHRDCAECEALMARTRAMESRRVQFRFTADELADRLGLPADHRIVRMAVWEEPHTLVLVVEGPSFDLVPNSAEAPVATLRP